MDELSDPLTAAQLEDENETFSDDRCPQVDELWFTIWRDCHLYAGKLAHLTSILL